VPSVLRRVRYDNWDVEMNTNWPTGALSDLAPDKENEYSVWHIDDDHSNLNRVIAALSANRQHVVHFDYLLIEYQLLVSIHITIEQTLGDSPDDQANKLWHRNFNLSEMNTSKRLELAEAIRLHTKVNRCRQKDVFQLLKECVKLEYIDLGKSSLKQNDKQKIMRMIEQDKPVQ
jgi:hypothetical protein